MDCGYEFVDGCVVGRIRLDGKEMLFGCWCYGEVEEESRSGRGVEIRRAWGGKVKMGRVGECYGDVEGSNCGNGKLYLCV